MKDRYVFPIFDKANRSSGGGRKRRHGITNQLKVEARVGEKRSWAYPLKYNLKVPTFKEKEVFLSGKRGRTCWLSGRWGSKTAL